MPVSSAQDPVPPTRSASHGAPPLTPRHLEILSNVARGRTNRQIGEILGISEKTVRNHMRTISHRLNTSDRTHAVVLAIGNGWIPLPIEPYIEPEREPAQRVTSIRTGARAAGAD